MKRTSESATWVLKMCRNFFFYSLIYVPFPLQKVCTAPHPFCPGSSRQRGRGWGGEIASTLAPTPPRGRLDLGVRGLEPPSQPGARGGGGAPRGGSGGGGRLAGQAGTPVLSPEDGAGTSAEHPSWLQTTAAPPPPSRNHCPLEVQPPVLDSNKSFMPVSTFSANFP